VNLKVRQLSNVERETIDYPEEQPWETPTPVPEGFRLIGRDGLYCLGETVWWEYKGKGYLYGRTLRCRPDFEYCLKVNDEAILIPREAAAMKEILKTTRDTSVRKALAARLRLHEEAADLRDTKRGVRRFLRRHRI
jgi:hypothetical protein